MFGISDITKIELDSLENSKQLQLKEKSSYEASKYECDITRRICHLERIYTLTHPLPPFDYLIHRNPITSLKKQYKDHQICCLTEVNPYGRKIAKKIAIRMTSAFRFLENVKIWEIATIKAPCQAKKDSEIGSILFRDKENRAHSDLYDLLMEYPNRLSKVLRMHLDLINSESVRSLKVKIIEELASRISSFIKLITNLNNETVFQKSIHGFITKTLNHLRFSNVSVWEQRFHWFLPKNRKSQMSEFSNVTDFERIQYRHFLKGEDSEGVFFSKEQCLSIQLFLEMKEILNPVLYQIDKDLIKLHKLIPICRNWLNNTRATAFNLCARNFEEVRALVEFREKTVGKDRSIKSLDDDTRTVRIEKRTSDWWFLKSKNEKWIGDFLAAARKCEGHVHGEALIDRETYLSIALTTKCYYDRKTKVFTEQFDPDYIVSSEIDKKLRKEILDLMNIGRRPSRYSGREYFFDHMCPLIDSINALIPFKIQLELMLKRLIEKRYAYAEIIIDLPKLRRKPPNLLDLFFSSELDLLKERFLRKEITPQTYKELLEPLFEIGWEILNTGRYLKKGVEKMHSELQEADAHVKQYYAHIPKLPEYNFLFPVMRNENPSSFFLQTAEIFALMQKNQQVGGYQLLGDESSKEARDNYLEQLFMIDFCSRKANGPIVLHSGELSKEIVEKHGLSDQIMKAIHLGLKEPGKGRKVLRISHALSISDQELDELAKLDICVEVCLTSNELLFDIKPEDHIIHRLIRKGIHFTLNTDDPTHFNTSLAKELKKAVTFYGLGYAQIKNCERNVFYFSAGLRGESIYEKDPQKPGWLKIKDLSKGIDQIDWKISQEAQIFINNSKKAQVETNWEQEIVEHECEQALIDKTSLKQLETAIEDTR